MTTIGVRLVEGLAARGVDTVFGIPGVHTVELYRGLEAGRAAGALRHITARHEQSAAFMADGYARTTGRPGVAFVITGPGITNALTAMAQSAADSVPVLIVSGVSRRGHLGRGLGQLHELPDQRALVATLCPTRQIDGAEDVGPALDWAFSAMMEGRPGPVHLQVPLDVMALPCGPLPPPAPPAPPPAGDGALLDAAAALLSDLRSPILLAGGGVRHAEDALLRLAETLDAPVILTANARGCLFRHPLAVPASASLPVLAEAIRAADGALALGTELGPTDYDVYATGRLPLPRRMVRIDIDAGQLSRHPAEIALRAEAGLAARALAARIRPANRNGALRAAALRDAAESGLAALDPKMPFRRRMVEAMRDALPGSVIVGDSTQPVYAANLAYAHDRAAGWFNAATGYGALGFGPGAAIGAAAGVPGVPVIALLGDGGLQFAAAELRTATDERLPVRFVVWNNAGFAEIAEAMAGAGLPPLGCTPSPLDHRALADAVGMPFTAVAADPAALADALRAAPTGGPSLIEIDARGV